MVSFAEILQETCGVDENELSKCFVTASFAYYKNGIEVNTSDLPVDGAIIDIEGRGPFAQVSAIFENKENKELEKLWSSLETYGRNMAKYEGTDEKVFCTFVFVPRTFEGEYMITAIAPIFWVLQPESPQSEQYAVRMLFNSSDINFLQPNIQA